LKSNQFGQELIALIRLLVICAVMFGLIALPGIGSASHSPQTWIASETDRHAELAAIGTSEATHSHEDGEPVEQALGHLHGHDPADHSHQQAFFADDAADFVLRPVKSWHSGPLSSPKQKPVDGILRPPKSLFVA
jgi:hypothetical protein